jgi:hypothetical protein
MSSAVFLLYALAQLALFVWLLRVYRATGAAVALLLFVPQFFLFYDNFIVGIGRWIGPGETLEALSWPRFWAHWLAGSWLIIAAGAIARHAGFAWAKPRWVMAAFCIVTVALIVGHDLPNFWRVELHPVCVGDTVRYTSTVREGQSCLDPAFTLAQRNGFPLAPIVTNFIVIAVGVALAVGRRFPWMLVGAVLMLVTAAVPALRAMRADNFGEMLIAGGVIWAVARFAPRRRATAAGVPVQA